MRRGVVWVIGGSDSSGGAGIQADLATLQDLGVPSCTLVSAITAQSHRALFEVVPSSVATLQAQWDAAVDTALPAVIKIGLLCHQSQVAWLSHQLKTLPKPPWIILDPVLESSSRGMLVEDGTVKAIRNELLPVVSLVTPNLPECQVLFGTTAADEVAIFLQSLRLRSPASQTHVLIKGGHSLECNQGIDHSMVDRLVGPMLNAQLVGRQVDTTKLRGTGCTLASAIAAFYVHMLQEQRLHPECFKEALVLAKAYLQQGLAQASTDPDPLSEHGYSKEGFSEDALCKDAVCMDSLPKVSLRPPIPLGPCPKAGWPEMPRSFPILGSMEAKGIDEQGTQHGSIQWLSTKRAEAFKSISLLRNRGLLYPIVSSLDHLELCLKYHVPMVQLRLKTGSASYRLQRIRTAIKMAKNTETHLYINDEWRWALEEQAFGVHLGQEDLLTAPLSLIREAGLALGVSTHGYWELLTSIQMNPSYVAIGSIFPTKTKDMTGRIQGLNHLRRLASICSHFDIPCVAIGGIQLDNLSSVLSAQVNAVAVVSAITQASNPAQAIQLWLDKLEQEKLGLDRLQREEPRWGETKIAARV